jgi:phenylalanyl-tRNA synthetase alpha chain
MDLAKVRDELERQARAGENVLKSTTWQQATDHIIELERQRRADFGRELNDIKRSLEAIMEETAKATAPKVATLPPIDITAPFASSAKNQAAKVPTLGTADKGSRHPLTQEIERVVAIYRDMGFTAVESRQLDDDFNMFEALNFPDGHPARDSYDSFRTREGFIPPAHTSTMQNRILKAGRTALIEENKPIACVSYGRCFRNEDADATHEHTFYQCEGVFVSRDATLAQMLGVLRNFFETYYGQKLQVKTQPAFFPFVEPGLEFLIEKPAAMTSSNEANRQNTESEWMEMLGCGMIHPNVLKLAGLDPTEFRGFAWGGGIDRLVMLARHINDIRVFESGRIKALRELK